MIGRPHRAQRRPSLVGSEVDRMALTMLRRLTRHADTVTTTNVSSTPMA